MRSRLAVGVAVVAIVGSSCGGSVGSNDWSIVGTTPDERHLLVSTPFGGVASGCTRWEGWEVDESEDRVEIRAMVWRKRLPSACTTEGVVETIAIDLAEPLGNRDLVGCGRADCNTLELEPGLGPWEVDAVTSDDGVVVASSGMLWSLDNLGAERWSLESGTTLLTQAPFDSIVAFDGTATTAFDPETAAEVWQAEGSVAAIGESALYLCRGPNAEGLAAVDPATGVDIWQVTVPCHHLAVGNGELTIVAFDPEIDGGHELFVLATATGRLIQEEKFDDGVDDRVGGFDGVTVVGERVVVAGVQADLVVLGHDGDVVLRRPAALGAPIGVVDGLVVLTSHDRVATVDPMTGNTVWQSPELDRESVAVTNGVLWSLDWPTGGFSRLDPRSGQAMWTTPVGLTSGFAVAAGPTMVYVATSLAVIALDPMTGEVQWWGHLPFEQRPG